MSSRALTTGEISDYCGVHFRTVIRWIERGELKAYQLPGRGDNRVQPNDFIEFLQRNRMPVPEEFLPDNRRVLIADDDKAIAHSIARVLKPAGFEVAMAPDGLQTGMLLERFRPRVLTLDLNMPGLSGFQVLSLIKAAPELAGVRILVISALGRDALHRAVEQGADEALPKPFDNAVLLTKIRKLASTATTLAPASINPPRPGKDRVPPQ